MAGFMLHAGGARAGVITNGSFEINSVSQGLDGVPLSSGNTDVTGWIIGNSNNSVYWEDSAGHGNPVQDGNYDISIGHNGNTGETLSQSFATTPGTKYSVRYYLSQIQFNGGDGQTMNASVTGSVLTGSQNLIVPTDQDIWHLEQFNFTADAASSTLTFTDTTPGDQGFQSNFALDNVVVTATPEPASLGLIAVAAWMLTGRSRGTRLSTPTTPFA